MNNKQTNRWAAQARRSHYLFFFLIIYFFWYGIMVYRCYCIFFTILSYPGFIFIFRISRFMWSIVWSVPESTCSWWAIYVREIGLNIVFSCLRGEFDVNVFLWLKDKAPYGQQPYIHGWAPGFHREESPLLGQTAPDHPGYQHHYEQGGGKLTKHKYNHPGLLCCLLLNHARHLVWELHLLICKPIGLLVHKHCRWIDAVWRAHHV